MFVLNFFRRGLPIFLLATSLTVAETQLMVEHEDPLEVDKNLTLSKTIDSAMEKYPDATWLKSLEDEALALAKRGQSYTAGASQATLRFQEATSGTMHYVDAGVQVPLWNPGQQNAQKTIAKYAESSGVAQTAAVKLRLAGLIRVALWDIELQAIRYEQALADFNLVEGIMGKVERRVQLGDLPASDLLFAETERLQKLSTLTQVEAELMHARKRYTSVTQSTKMPEQYDEKLVDLKEIKSNHPALTAINSEIERKQAELKATRLIGSGQSTFAIGINSDRGFNDDRSNETESFNVGVNVPFGGESHLAPQLAAIHVSIAKLMSEREQLFRDLEQAHHEAEHNLKVNEVELQIANQLQQTAEDHLKMMQLSFSVGEIDLMDLLKIQARTQQAVLNAKERAVILERDKALYNQAVGIMP